MKSLVILSLPRNQIDILVVMVRHQPINTYFEQNAHINDSAIYGGIQIDYFFLPSFLIVPISLSKTRINHKYIYCNQKRNTIQYRTLLNVLLAIISPLD